MIWVRRALTVPLGILLIVPVLLALILLQVSDTFIKPNYYAEELDKADIYEFVLVDLLASALDDVRKLDSDEFGDGLNSNPLVSSALTTEDIVSSVNRVLPPEFVQEQVEQVFDQLGRYITGEREDFEVTILAGEQAKILVAEISSLIRKSDAYNVLFDEVITPEADKALDQELPFGLRVTGADLVKSARVVAPRPWVEAQIDHVLDETTPYLVGESDTFEIRIALADRIELALTEVKELLRKVEAYDLLYDEVIEPEVRKQLGWAVELPFGFSITDDEVLGALREVAPVAWVQGEAERLINEAGPYLSGKTDRFAIEISLVDNKRDARRVILKTATGKLRDALQDLPTCTPAQLRNFDLSSLTMIPDCLPLQIEPDLIMDQLTGGVNDAADSLVLGAIPDRFLFTDANLRETLAIADAEDNLELIDVVREMIGNGWTYDQDDLRAALVRLTEENKGFTDAAGSTSFSAPSVGNRMRVRASKDGVEGLIWVDLEEGGRVLESSGELRLQIDGGTRPGAAPTVSVSNTGGNPVQGAEVAVSHDEILEVLDEVRAYLSDGWRYETSEFRGHLAAVTDDQTVEYFDDGRDYLDRARSLRLLVYLPMVLVVVLIGFLGGRSWPGRVGWGAGYLAVTAVLVFVAFGPVYSTVAQGPLDDAREETLQEISFNSDFENTQRLAFNKAFDMAESIVDGFASGIATKAFLLVIIGLIPVSASIFWATIWAFISSLRSRLASD